MVQQQLPSGTDFENFAIASPVMRISHRTPYVSVHKSVDVNIEPKQ